MGGTDTYRGIAYQHAQAVLSALDVVGAEDYAAIRVEGRDDYFDIELLDADERIVLAKQVKVRAEPYTWSKSDLLLMLRRWAAADAPESASFEFVTDGSLGPSGEKVRNALVAASAGRREELAALLGEEPNSAVVWRAARVRIVQDDQGTDALLSKAERRLMDLLPGMRSSADARQQATIAVDTLYRLLMERACQPSAADRCVSQDEICRSLGIPADANVVLPWASVLREWYIEAAASSEGSSVPAVLIPETPASPNDRDSTAGVGVLLAGGPPVVVAGPTGAGKSTAAREVRSVAASQRRVVVIVHAESYISGRLDTLIAEAVSAVLGSAQSAAVGRHILMEPGALVVIDGVSEIPDTTRAALAEDLRVPIAAGWGARFVLLGRGLAAIRSVLPLSVAPLVYRIGEFDQTRRAELARTILASSDRGENARLALAGAERALGDAAGNPMLLSMALDLFASNRRVENRAAVYNAFIERLGEKSGAVGLGVAATVLGGCFSRLLDQQRRYADPYTWRKLLREEAQNQSNLIGPIDANEVEQVGRRAGLIVELDQSETVVAIHDSFADYLAGRALALKAVPFPSRVRQSDEERLLFAAQISGMDQAFSQSIATHLPFALPKFTPFDRRGPDEFDPEDVVAMVSKLVPSGASTCTDLWRTSDDRVVAVVREGQGPGEWLHDAAAREALRTRPSVVGAGGPVDLAVRLWRQWLQARLREDRGIGRATPRTIEDARNAVAAHTTEVARLIEELIDMLVPPQHHRILKDEIGPVGLTGLVYPSPPRELREDGAWLVAYNRTERIHVESAVGLGVPGNYQVYGSIESFTRHSPSVEAARRVAHAIDQLAGGLWL